MIRVLFNQKGGVGKSSIAVNLAAISAAQGLKTLVIDLDTQCNASQYLNAEQPKDNIADLFEQFITFHLHRRPASEFCQATAFTNLDLLPGSARLANIESELHSRHKIFKLKESLANLTGHYQRIYIDTAPALNFYSLSALIGAQRCLIPIDCDDFSRQGLYNLYQRIEEIREDHNPDLQIEGVIANQYMANAKLPNQIIRDLQQEQLPVLPVYLGQSVKMRESHQARQPLIHLSPRHKLSQSLLSLHNLLESQVD